MPKRFDRPVSIFVGLGFPREVETLLDAFHVLTECTGSRGPDHAQARASCREALMGRIDISVAREDFEAFARNHGILAADALERSAALHAQQWLPAA